MKSGLKDRRARRGIHSARGSNHCRDEKRTESLNIHADRYSFVFVATIAAMKSGLKDGRLATMTAQSKGSNHCRDEKRTERRIVLSVRSALLIRSNHCRDEKRTESLQRGIIRPFSNIVATIAAMKSGLKGWNVLANTSIASTVATIAAMKSGLKVMRHAS